MTKKYQPKKVCVGQIWADKDERSRGAGEFVVKEISGRLLTNGELGVKVYRFATGRHSVISERRFFDRRKPYRYVGRKR